MRENSIITLENNVKYIILDKVHLDNEIYYFCTKTETNDKKVEDKLKFFIEKKEDNNYFLAEVKNRETLSSLIKIVKNLS